jgi:uncharacterized metal-binding protein YceD (DUF177 family)
MFIDLRILPAGRSVIEQSVKLTEEQEKDSGVTGEVACRAVVDGLKFRIHMSVSFSCTANAVCSRCLKEITVPLQGQYRIVLENKNSVRQTGDNDDEADFFFTDSDKDIDTRQALYEEIVCAFPIKPLCSAECLPAVPEGEESAAAWAGPDSRWDALKKLKNN